jgi:hypothetical protein
MNKFNTFEELVTERKRLEIDLHNQKAFLREQVIEVREKLAPIAKVLAFFARFGQTGNSPAAHLLKMGSTFGIDLLVKSKLKKAGWLARLVLPLVMKFTANKSIDAIQAVKR